MSHSKERDNDDLQFCWGKKRGFGGAKKDIQFYESFTYDGVDYSLYDTVYLYKEGAEPYIGKLVKIWEQQNKKKVKIVWFFRPSDIFNYLEDYAPFEKEIFLASGEGVGLANINPLEAIAGKCCVICISKDERNPQASDEDLEMADYIFCRTFDVEHYKISDKIADKIAGLEVRHLLNRKEDQKLNSVIKIEANGVDVNGKTDASTGVLHNLSKLDTPTTLKNSLNDDKLGHVASPVLRDDGTDSKHLSGVKIVPKSETIPGKDGASAVKATVSRDEVQQISAKELVHAGVSDDRPSKKMRLNDYSMKLSDGLQKNKSDTGARKLKIESDEDADEAPDVSVRKFEDKAKSILVKDSAKLDNESSRKLKLDEKRAKPSDDLRQKASPAVLLDTDTKADDQILEVTRRPDADRSKWFKGIPWEGRMQNADEQGTLVLLENLDPSYTSGEVEDIVYHSLKQSCTAKVIQQATFQNPHYGQAYVIFKTRDAAELAVRQINKGCLMLPNGRPLVARKGMPKLPGKSSSFTGHLLIDKIKLQMQREEMRKAVSTSHCSQPNTIEYEMAMDWMLIQEKSVSWWEELHKEHGEELKQIKKSLKTK